MENGKKIEIVLNCRPTKTFLKCLINSTLDLLLHTRHQIPFPFDSFEKFIKNKNLEISCFKTKKQLLLAKDTYEKLCAVKRIIDIEVSTTTVFLILFGRSIFTAREAFFLTLPTVDDRLMPTFFNERSMLRKVLLDLIQSNDLKCEENPPTTNIYFLFNRKERLEDNPDLHELRDFKLNKSCKVFHIHFHDNCDFEIFQEEFNNLSINDDTSVKTEEKDEHVTLWYQSKIFVKGFNDILVNNKSIWF